MWIRRDEKHQALLLPSRRSHSKNKPKRGWNWKSTTSCCLRPQKGSIKKKRSGNNRSRKPKAKKQQDQQQKQTQNSQQQKQKKQYANSDMEVDEMPPPQSSSLKRGRDELDKEDKPIKKEKWKERVTDRAKSQSVPS